MALTYFGTDKYYKMDIEAADIDGDGRDELAIVVGNVVQILDDEEQNFALLNSRDLSKGSQDTAGYHITTVTSGDLEGDGIKEFVAADGTVGSSNARYYVFGGSSATLLAEDAITHPSAGSFRMTNIATGDVDSDKRQEVVFAGETNSNNVYNVVFAKWNTNSRRLEFKDGYYQGSYNRDRNPVVPLATFNPEGLSDTPRDLVFAMNKVLEYDAFRNSVNVAGNTLDAYRNLAIGADFNNDGKEELTFTYVQDSTLLLSPATFLVYGKNEGGQITTLASTNLDQETARYSSLAAADVKGNSPILEFQRRDLQFSRPVVVAVLASPPYYADAVDPDNLSNYGTSFGNSSTSGSSTTKSFTVDTSFSIGYSAETPLIGSAGSSEFKATVGYSFTNTTEVAQETTTTRTYSSIGGEDLVIFTCIPVDVYTYKILRSTKPGLVGTGVRINIPREPQVISMSRDRYNALPALLVPIGDEVLDNYQVGNPRSYPVRSAIEARIKAGGSFGDGLWDPIGLTVGSSLGAITASVEQTEERVTTNGKGFSFEVEMTNVTAGVLWGASFGFEGTIEYGVKTATGTTIEGVVPNTVGNNNTTFRFGISSYKKEIEEQDEPFMVVTYWVE